MEDDEDDLYRQQSAVTQNGYNNNPGQGNGEDDEGEDIEEDSDSDIDIITERQPEPAKPDSAPKQQQPKRSEPGKSETAHTAPSAPDVPIESSGTPQAQPQQKYSAPKSSKPGSDYPAVHTSTLDIDASIPTYEPAGKNLAELDFDADLAENTKPWRLPGTDQTDYFNYGFDEFTWATYCLKQKNMREAITEQKAESAKFEMMFGGGLPGMPGQPQPPSQQPQQQQTSQPSQTPQGQAQQQPQANQPSGPGAPAMPGMPPMPGMPGMPDMTPDMMNQMMQQMMTSGIDPSQMDFGTFMQQMTAMQQGGPNIGGMAPNQQAQQQPQAYGGHPTQGYPGAVVNAGGQGGGGGGGGQQGGNQRRNQGRRW